MGIDKPDIFEVPERIARIIDHTLLKPEATEDDIRHLCWEAKKYDFASACVHPPYVSLASQILKKTTVRVCTVVGFPLGAHVSETKVLEARLAVEDGADEIDMVIHLGALKSGRYNLVYQDIRAVVDVCRGEGRLVKVIIEAALLTDGEKIEACRLACRAGAGYVKTSTGFGPCGATVHDVALMKEAVGGSPVGVKAAGGIRTYAEAVKMVEAGATRIGTSRGIQIVEEETKEKKGR
jgi:deoxyribose-phosphate aldolase